MRDLLTSGKIGSIELNAQKKIREDIQNRWDKLGLVEGLNGHVKETVATLYENQAKHLIYEATASDNSGSFETVVFPLIRRVFSKLLANDIVSVQAMNLPIGKLFFIKPVTSEREWNFQTPGQINDGDTASHHGLMGYERTDRNQNGMQNNRYYLPDEVVNTVSNGIAYEYETSTGKTVYALVATGATTFYADNKCTIPYTLGSGETATETGNSGRIEPKVTQFMKKSLYDLFYNDFLFDNSKGKVTIKVGSATVVTIAPTGDVVDYDTTNPYPVNSADGSLSSLILKVEGFNHFNAGRLTGPDGNEMDTEAFLASLKVINTNAITGGDDYASFAAGESVPFRVVTQKYGAGIVDYAGDGRNKNICDANGAILIELDLTKPCKKQGKTVNGYIGIDPTAYGTAALLPVNTSFQIAWCSYDSLELETEMGEVSFQLTSVTVSVEERKLRATWSPELAQDVSAFHNIDAEAELTAILSEQIAAEIDREILRDIRKAAPWQARWDYNGWQRLGTTSTVYTQKDWNQTLITKINQISAQIQKSTLRGGANFIVVSAEISAVLNDLEYFHVTDASAESDQYNMGIEKIGSLQGRYQVIVDPYAPHWSLIMGHHGTSLLDTGYIYAPYIPLALTPTMFNPFNFAPVKGICTRYAKKLVNNKFYGAVRVDGLMHWNINELR